MPLSRRELVEKCQRLYPVGTKVELIHMEDKYGPEPGTSGVVTHVDSIGQVHVDWANGSTLALIPGVDKWRVV